ncbi:hypothetical protein B0H11DRAFT_2225763 [Mycena galericulata]|nr:hypothetical protein B0H11DRAFT_2225763 [Mycena galericulata]
MLPAPADLLSYIDANATPLAGRQDSRHRSSTSWLKSGKFGEQPGSRVSPRPPQYCTQSDNCRLNTHTTVITYALCGFAYFTLAPCYAQTSNAAASTAPCTSITNLTTLTARLADPAGKTRVHGVTKSSLIADVDSTPGVPIALSANKIRVIMGSRRSTVIPVNIWSNRRLPRYTPFIQI